MKSRKQRIIIVLITTISCILLLVFGILYEINGLLNMSGIIFGWILATFTVNFFQRKSYEKEMRDKLFIFLEKVEISASKAMGSWNIWSANTSNETNFYNVSIHMVEIVNMTQLLVNRLINQFKLMGETKEQLEELVNVTDEWIGIINQSLRETDVSNQARDNIKEISKTYRSCLKHSILIILLSEFDY